MTKKYGSMMNLRALQNLFNMDVEPESVYEEELVKAMAARNSGMMNLNSL